MQFYRKKARTMGVPIVPMIDILTILLIFFIVHRRGSFHGATGRPGRDGEILHFPEREPGGDE